VGHSIAGTPVALTGLRVYKSTYVLVLEVPTPLQLVVGKLGHFDFPT
jgi:hypothetical protein